MKFIIEHLENGLSKWCLIEYTNISKNVGKENLIFTNVNKKYFSKLKKLGRVNEQSVLKLNLKNACILDLKAKKTISSDDKFDYFIFGGILGDYPEQGRTEKYLTSKLEHLEKRNLTEFQMSTDTAVIVTDKILKGTPISKLKFIDKPVILIKKGKFQEEIILPYRYLEKNNKPLMSKDLIKYLKNKKDI